MKFIVFALMLLSANAYSQMTPEEFQRQTQLNIQKAKAESDRILQQYSSKKVTPVNKPVVVKTTKQLTPYEQALLKQKQMEQENAQRLKEFNQRMAYHQAEADMIVNDPMMGIPQFIANRVIENAIRENQAKINNSGRNVAAEKKTTTKTTTTTKKKTSGSAASW